jgi:amino acid adenylation domain-containing protein/FkbM family methyltransferase
MSIAIDPYSQVPDIDCEPQTFIDLLRWRALNQGSRLAYTFLSDGENEEERLTYGELDRRARAIGAWLQSLAAHGERVLLLYPPGLDYIAAFFGCIYAGAVAVPAYPPRQNRSMLRLQSVVADAEATIALTTGPVLARIAPLFSQNPYLQPLRWLTTESIADGSEKQWQDPVLTGDSLVFLQYTSGSTSAPKGVMLSHRNLLHNEQMMQLAFRQTQDSVIVGWLPLYHDMGLIGNILQPLFVGAPCILMSPVSFLQQPSRWLTAISRYRATISGGPNFAYDLCVRKVTAEQRSTLDLSCWDVAFNGAEPVRHTTAEQFTKTFEECGFRPHAFQPCYGLAEATLLVSGHIWRRLPVVKTVQARDLLNDLVVEAATGAENTRSLVGCGQSLMGQQLIIVHPETLRQCTPGQVGEIWISGPSIAQGYWNRTEETERTFLASLADTTDGRFLRSGDLGFMENGELFVTGRLKDLVIIRGLNHYPQDIEFTVQSSHPSLRRDCGAAFSIEVMGEERLVIVQEVDRRKHANWDEVAELIVKAVAEEHEIEAYTVVLIKAGSVPKTSSGKIQRHACRLQYLDKSLTIVAEWRQAVAAEQKTDAAASASPAQSAEAVEAWLRSRLAAKLGMEFARIDVNQPLARYGLDSLTGIELMHGIETALNVSIPLASFLQSPTIVELTAEIVAQVNASGPAPQVTSVVSEEKQSEQPLSRGQQALWFLYQMSPTSAAYNISRAARIVSQCDLAALQRAFQSLVDRHSSLRTTIAAVEGVPVQRVHSQMDVCFQQEDAATWTDERLIEHLNEEAQRPFDLEQGPLFRVSVFRRSEGEHVLVVVAHHMIIDFWSLAVLVDELSTLYHGERAGASAQLAPLALHYADYVRWQDVMLKSADGDRLWAYWEKQLAGELPLLDLPTDRSRPAIQTYRGAAHSFELSAALSQQLKALGQSSGATLYMVLLAAFQTLLYRYTGQTDIVVGSPTSGRKWSALAGVMGYFVNPVVMRAQVTAAPTFIEFLRHVRQTALEAFEHQDYPFALLVERLQPERDASRSPLFQVMFALQKAPHFGEGGLSSFALSEDGARLKLRDLVLESIGLKRRVSQFDLTLMMAEANDEVRASLEYNEDLFDAITIERMAGHFKTLLKSIAADPAQHLYELPLLTAGERECLLVQWNETGREYPAGICLHELFEQQAARSPTATALVCGEARLSYAELNERAERLAKQLRRLKVGPESLVGLLCDRSAELIVGLLGILKAGAAYVPADPAYPRQRLRQIFADADCRLLVTQQKVLDALPEIAAAAEQVICVEELWGVEPESGVLSEVSEAAAASKVEPDNLAYVLYTSGSTGLPKGVAITHRSAVAMLHWALETYSQAQLAGVLASTSICFDLSVYEVFAALSCGGKVILAENVFQLPQLPAAGEVTLVNTVPSAMAELVRLGAVPASVVVVNLAGEALSGELVQEVYERTAALQVWNLYGPTEDTTYSTFALVDAAGVDRPPIGRPISNTRVYLLDQQMEPVVPGAVGELYLGGAGLARGYLGRPEITAERFVPNPFTAEGGGRLYRTGDLAKYRAAGELEYVGRVDHQVKVRGYRIELGEIEAALSQHPSVRDVVVVARDDADGNKRLVAYTVAEQDQALLTIELRAFLRERLPEYMVPSLYERLDALPLTSNGKLDRRALPEPEQKRGQLETGYVASHTPVEEILCDIWSAVLHVERVGVHDNFFDLGGHSLLATQVVSRMRTAFSVEIALRCLFETPTVAGLARRVEQEIGAGDGARPLPIERASRDEPLALSFAQQRLWFLDQLEPGRSDYNIPIAVRLTGTLDLAALEQTLSEVVRRHEVLRTTFAVLNEKPVQLIHPPRPFELPLVNLSGMAQSQRELEAQRRVAEEAQRPFSLSTEPLVRGELLRLGSDEYVLMLTMHHIVSDGWSLQVLVKEVAALYEAFTSGAAPALEALPIQYADYAAWQREWLQGTVLDEQLSYWKQQLSGAPPVLELPTDRARPAVQTHRGAVTTFQLNADLTRSLKRLSRREGVTLFMTLAAGFKTLLHRYSGQDEIVVGVPIAGRNRAETEALIGFFVNTLVLRTNLGGDPTFCELMQRVKEVALSAYAHQDVPFEKLVEELQPERNMSHSPLFQVTMALQNAAGEELALPGLNLSALENESVSAKFDLTLAMIETEEEIAGSLEYNSDLFDSIRIKRMLMHFENLLLAAVNNPEQQVSTIQLLTEAEREDVLVKWNHTGCDYGQDKRLHQLFEEQVERAPQAAALVFEDDHLSYDELNKQANQLARYLRGLGVGPEVRVGVLMERSTEMVISLLAVLKAGGAYVPLDPAYPCERLSFMLEDSSVSLLLTRHPLSGNLVPHSAKRICVDTDRHRWKHESQSNLDVTVEADNLAYVIFTSGSTGRPKGAMNSHRAIVNRLFWMQQAYALTPADVVMQKTPFSFDVSVWEFFWPLMTGARLVIARPGGHQDPAYLVQHIEEQQITVLHFVPSMLQLFIEERQVATACRSVRQVICSGEALSYALQERFFERLPKVELANLYGPTETAVDVTSWECERETPRQVVPIGRPIANTQIYIVDERMQPAPIGVAGEVLIGGVGVGRGYLARPELTAERFIPDRFSRAGGERLYRTGDLGRYGEDGAIEYLGRLDNQVKLRGHRIELGEIEAVLRQHPAVQEATVLVGDDAVTGKRLVAYLVPSKQRAPVVCQLLRLEREGRFAEQSYYELPNGLAVIHQNRGETEFLYQEIFVEQSYLKHGITLEAGDCIFDVGANIGMFSLFVRQQCPTAKVYAFEPLPPLFQVLKMNMALYAADVQVFECGLSNQTKSEMFTFYPHLTILSGRHADVSEEREVVKSFLLREGTDDETNAEMVEELLSARLDKESYVCQLKSISEVIAEQAVERIDLLKIDVEKSEIEVLAGIKPEDWQKIRQLVVEVHDVEGRLEHVKSLLKKHGYALVVEQDRTLKQTRLYNIYAVREASKQYRANSVKVGRLNAEIERQWNGPRELTNEVRDYLREKLPAYMVPSIFMLIEEMPLTPNGKLDHRALPRKSGLGDEAEYEEPRTPVEQWLAETWAAVLGLERVGVNDNFFDLGGHSLLGTQIIFRVRESFRLELPLRSLFEAPTVAGLAERIEDMRRAALPLTAGASYHEMDHGRHHAAAAAGGNGASSRRSLAMPRSQKSIPPPILPTPRDGPLQLSFAQQRLWFLEQLAAGNSTYNMLGGVRLSGQLDTIALERTINEIVRRHEILRTTFVNTDGRPLQVVAASRPLTVELLDLRALPASEHEAAMEQLASEELRRTFDLSKGTLLRVKLLRLDEDEHVALVAMHHIISDGWSIGIFLLEVKELYKAFRNGEPSPLHDLPIQYADFAQWQHEWLRGEVLEAQLDYWRSTLSGTLPLLELPAALPRPSQPTFRSARLSSLLPAGLCEELRRLSRRRGVTLYMTLLAGFKTLLYRYTKQDDIIVGTAVSGRNYAGVEELIGVFINMLVMRTDLSGNPRFSELLDRVKEVALQAYAHQDVPFEKLVVELQPQRELSQTPLFQVAFGLQNAPVKTLHLPQLQLTPMTFNVEMARYDLTLWMIEGENGLTASWTYSTDLFHASSVIRMQTHFESLLRSIVADPETQLSALEMYSKAEKKEQAAQDEGWKEVHVKKLVSGRRRAVNRAAQSLTDAGAD